MDANNQLAPSQDRVSETDLCRWLGAAAPGDQLVYHRGFLAVDRDPIAGRLTERERAELRRVARRAMLAAESGLADLVQRRNGAGDFTYVLIARARPKMAEGSLRAILAEQACEARIARSIRSPQTNRSKPARSIGWSI
jgi:hypothetical protein